MNEPDRNETVEHLPETVDHVGSLDSSLRAALDDLLTRQGELWRSGQGVAVEQLVADRPELRVGPAMVERIVHEAILRE